MSYGIFDARHPFECKGVFFPCPSLDKGQCGIQIRCREGVCQCHFPFPQYLALARSCRASTWKHHDEEATFYQALMEASLQPSVALASPECRQGASCRSILHHSSRKCGAPPGVGFLGLPGQRERMQQCNQGCWSTLQGCHGEPCFNPKSTCFDFGVRDVLSFRQHYATSRLVSRVTKY